MGVCIPSPTFIHLETKLNSAVPLSLVVYFRDGAVRWWPTEIRCDASRPRMSNNYTVTGVKNHFLVGNAVHSFFSCLSPLFRILVLLLFRLRRNYRAVMWNNSMTRAEDGYVGQYFPWLEEVNVRYILFWWIITSADRKLTYIRNFREITGWVHTKLPQQIRLILYTLARILYTVVLVHEEEICYNVRASNTRRIENTNFKLFVTNNQNIRLVPLRYSFIKIKAQDFFIHLIVNR